MGFDWMGEGCMDDGEPLGQVEGFQRAVFTQEKLLNCHCSFVTGFGLGKFCQLTFCNGN